MAEKRIYLDYNATTPLKPEVRDEIIADLQIYGNASSMHTDGREARARVEAARRAVAALIGSPAGDIIFTSGGSESNNTVFQTFRRAASDAQGVMLKSGRTEFITTAIEHPCVLNAAGYLKSLGFRVTFLPVDEFGMIKMDAYRAALSEKTLLVSVMYANNEIGAIENFKEIARLAKERGAFVHTDATQAVGKIPVDVTELGADYLTMSAHKIYGPKGIGALYRRHGAPLFPLIHGGHQEEGFRAGTYNNSAILGFGKAAELAMASLPDYGKAMRALRNRLRDGLLSRVPNIKVNGPPEDERVLPNTLNVSFPGAEGESILLSLDLKGIEASTGSACASGSLDPSHVLMAIGVWPELAHGSIRFSMGWGNSAEEIDYVLDVLPPIIARLRAMSTVSY
ncbi:MAG: aminotransferase class V-fold PLP-dependent enzyme [Spirochaetaceae bacterium]|nr:aminotransferase class V-fold PLP-dependent enzyme [Spirochaetaceae bacterium]